MSEEEKDDGFRLTPILHLLEKKILNNLLREALKRLSQLGIDEKHDRVRIVFEFEFKDGKIKDLRIFLSLFNFLPASISFFLRLTEEINFYSRDSKYGWLSNFARFNQMIDGITYKTNEHYYQSEKAISDEDKEWIRNAPSPYLAMNGGRSLRYGKEMRPDWNNAKVQIMLTGLRAKFSQNPDLKAQLLATGNAILHENSPSDMFWGKKGQDVLGKLLMLVRDELRRSP